MKKLKSILLIDDDEPTGFLYKMIVGAADCTENVCVLQNGQDALDYINNAIPDLIFLDINMPRMNGWEFMEKFNNIENTLLKIPVIIMISTTLNPDDEVKALGTKNISGFMRKPLTVKALNEAINKYFSD